jgi:outer membrane receptor protein involved in Fe transport
VRYSKTLQHDPNFGASSVTSLALNSQWRTDVTPVEVLVGQVFSDWTDNFSTEFKLSRRKVSTVPENNSTEPSLTIAFTGALPASAGTGVSSGTRNLNFGTDFSRQFNILRTDTIDAYFGGTYRHGDHEIKFGGDYAKNEVYNAFLQGIYGSYTFGCLDAATGFTYGFNANSTTFRCNTASAADIQSAALENFSRGRPQNFSVQIPTPGNTYDNAIAQFTLKNTGLFLQDTWTVNNRLTLNGGVRVDKMSIPERPTRNVAAAAPVIAGGVTTNANGSQTYTPQTGGFGYDNTVTPDGASLFQPRVGFNYRFEGELPSQLRGGFGLFQGAAMNVWLGNAFSNPGIATRTIGCNTLSPSTTTPRCPTTDNFFVPTSTGQPTTISGATASPTIKVDLLSPDLRQPAVWKANLGYEKQLPWGGIVFGLEYLRTDVKSALYYKHLNLGAPVRFGPDGRELYWTLQGYNPACFSTTGGTTTSGVCAGLTKKPLANPAYGDVILAENTSKGGGNTATISLSRALSKGFGWSFAYTYTDATEVSNLTSSTSSSQWNTRSTFNPNEDTEGNSAYLVKDRFSGSLTWQKAFFGSYKTTVGAFLESRSGRPFSWVYSNDMNGDNITANDLMFIPSAPGSGEVVFQGDTATSHLQEDRFWAFVNSEPSLIAAKGSVPKRSSGFSAWTNTLDMRVSQEIPGFFKGHKGVFTLDFMNVGNMINKRWGLIEEVSFPQRRSFVAYAGIDPVSGKYVYAVLPTMTQPIIKQNKGESQWAIQATAKYEF